MTESRHLRLRAPRTLLRLGPSLAVAALVLALFPTSAMADGATHFGITGLSSEVTAGDSHTYTITALDGSDETDATYEGASNTVDVTCSDTVPDVACPAHPTDFTDGVATVDVTFITAGPQTISATDSLISGISDPITVDPAGLDHFVVNHVDDQVAGTAFDVTATAQDFWNNTILTYASSPTISDSFSSTGGTPVDGSFGTFSSGVGTATGTIDYTAESGVKVTVNDGAVHSDSNDFTVAPGSATAVTIETAANGSGSVVGSQGLTSGSTLQVYAITRDASGNFVANPSATWSLTNISGGVVSGDLAPTSGASTTLTGHVTGSATIHVVDGGFNADTGTITVNHGSATAVTIETAANGSGSVVGSQGLTSGSTLQVYAITRDASGNFVANPSATWSLTNISGGVVSGDLAPTSGASTTLTGHVTGSATIHVVDGGFNADTGTITVNHGSATAVTIETAANGSGSVVGSQGLTSGSTLQVYAITRDASGNFVANPSATWSLTNISGGVVSGDLAPTSGASTTLTGHVTGSATIHVVDGGFNADTGTITVNHGSATAVTIETAANGSGSVVGSQGLTSGSTLQVYAITRDASGNFVANPSATWSLTNISGGVVSGDLAPTSGASTTLTGHVTGSATIHVVDGGFNADTGTITVNHGSATQLVVAAPVSVGVGAAFTITVTAKDAYGNTDTGYTGTVHFTSSDSAATVPANSTLTSGTKTFTNGVTFGNSGTQTVTATDTVHALITGLASVSVTGSATSNTAVSSDTNPTTYGGSVTFTATVTGAGATPSGTVQFLDGSNDLGTPVTLCREAWPTTQPPL